MTEDQLRLQTATREWLERERAHFTHALTLTLKPYRKVTNDFGVTYEALTKDKASRSLRHFVNRINHALYGNAAKRNGKTIALVAALEGEASGKLLHYHCAVGGLPEWLSVREFEAQSRATWLRTDFGNEQIKVAPMSSSGWLDYMSKEVGWKDADVIDWENVVLPRAHR